MDFTDYLNKVNQKLENGRLYYLTNDPERGIGLELLLLNYMLVYIDKSQFTNYFKKIGLPHLCLQDNLNSGEDVYRSSLKLIKHPIFKKIFAETKKSSNFIQTFKISPAFAVETQKLDANPVNTSAELNRMFENKISQFNSLIGQLDVSKPKTIITILKETDFKQISLTLKLPFVVQFNIGHTGESTIFINTEAEFTTLINNFPNRVVKISEFIKGEPYTVNACVGSNGVYVAGLSYQITGIEGLTTYAGATVGNDWYCRKGVTARTEGILIKDAERIGGLMRNSGYKGLFGIDIIVRDEVPYVIEINARQPASVPMHTKMQLESGQTPLALIHLMEFLGIEYNIDARVYNEEAIKPLAFSQIFNRAKNDVQISSQVKMGEYRLVSDNSAINPETGEVKPNTIFLDEERDKPLIYVNESYTIDSLGNNGILVMTPVKARNIKKGGEIARIQLNQSVITDNGLSPWIKEALIAIENFQIQR